MVRRSIDKTEQTRLLQVLLIVSTISLLTFSIPSRAAGSVPATLVNYTCYNAAPELLILTNYAQCYSIWQARDGGLHYNHCLNIVGGTMNVFVNKYSNGQFASYGFTCTHPAGGGGFALPNYTCPNGAPHQDGMCAVACPVNAEPSNDPSNPCVCKAGYEWDATHTSCESTCPIKDDLPQITDPDVQAFEDNPNLSDTARLDPAMKTALQKLLDAASAVGGAPSVGSAYRPPAYNQHLIDVWNKREEFLDAVDRPEVTSNASCMLVLWPKVQRHFQKHGLLDTQPPVPNSRHTRGLAVDVSIDLPPANIDAVAAGAGLRRPLPDTDPVHFQFP